MVASAADSFACKEILTTELYTTFSIKDKVCNAIILQYIKSILNLFVYGYLLCQYFLSFSP